MKVDVEAIKLHKLEQKLRDAMAGMGVLREVLLECFRPDVQLKESFFDHLGNLVGQFLKKGEDLGEKLYSTLKILNPTTQIRNADLPNLSATQSYQLIHDG